MSEELGYVRVRMLISSMFDGLAHSLLLVRQAHPLRSLISFQISQATDRIITMRDGRIANDSWSDKK